MYPEDQIQRLEGKTVRFTRERGDGETQSLTDYVEWQSLDDPLCFRLRDFGYFGLSRVQEWTAKVIWADETRSGGSARTPLSGR